MWRNKKIYNINRRNFLRGLGLLTIPLPCFEFMLSAHGDSYANGQALPKRFLLMKSGTGAGTDCDVNNNYQVDAAHMDINGFKRNLLTPLQFGANYQVGPGTTVLNNYANLKPYIGFFSNGANPWRAGNTTMNDLLPGGHSGSYHIGANYAHLTGLRKWAIDAGVYNYGVEAGGISGDRLLMNEMNPNESKWIHLNISGQANGADHDCLQFVNSQGVDPYTSPRILFDRLFGNFTAPGAMVDPAAAIELNKRKSVLDLLQKERVEFLKRELSTSEKVIFNNHLDYIRDLELRVRNIQPVASVAPNCRKPATPGNPGSLSETLDMFNELVVMALACDISRHGTFRLTCDQAGGNIPGSNPVVDFHVSTHYADGITKEACLAANITAQNFYTGKFFALAEKLRLLPEGAGNMLDNSALMFMAEGGVGPSAEGAGDNQNSHSVENLTFILAGKVGGLKTGSHVKLNRVHTAKVILSCLKAAGLVGNTLGSQTGAEPLIWAG